MIHETLKDIHILHISKEQKKSLKTAQIITFQSCCLPWKCKSRIHFRSQNHPEQKYLHYYMGLIQSLKSAGTVT